MHLKILKEVPAKISSASMKRLHSRFVELCGGEVEALVGEVAGGTLSATVSFDGFALDWASGEIMYKFFDMSTFKDLVKKWSRLTSTCAWFHARPFFFHGIGDLNFFIPVD